MNDPTELRKGRRRPCGKTIRRGLISRSTLESEWKGQKTDPDPEPEYEFPDKMHARCRLGRRNGSSSPKIAGELDVQPKEAKSHGKTKKKPAKDSSRLKEQSKLKPMSMPKPKPKVTEEAYSEICVDKYKLVTKPCKVITQKDGNKYRLVPEELDPTKWTWRDDALRGNRRHNMILYRYDTELMNYFGGHDLARSVKGRRFIPEPVSDGEESQSQQKQGKKPEKSGHSGKSRAISDEFGEYKNYLRYMC